MKQLQNVCFFIIIFFLSCNKLSSLKFQTLEYSELEKLDIQLPFVKQYGKEKQLLVYGSYHTSDPTDSEVVNIEQTFLNFNPDLLLYEGDGISFGKTKRESLEYFEMGLVLYLADSLKIKAINIEPNSKDKYDYLLSKYPKNQVLLSILGLQITMMQAVNENFQNKYPIMIKDLIREGFSLTKEEQSIEYFYKIYKDFYKIEFSYENFDPNTIQAKSNKTILNEINQVSNKFRDQHILALVNDKLKNYNKIYLQIGGWHAIVCEPGFEQIMNISNFK
jgi:hypothetical protein